MKRIGKFLMAAMVAMLFCATVNAQDLTQATELYNTAATALNEGNNAAALEGFNKALTMAATLGEEGATMVNDCKGIIPKILLQMGKDAANAKDLDGAIAKLKEAVAKAKEYGQAEVATEAKELIPQIVIADANTLLNEGKFTEAAAEYKKATELDPESGVAFLRLGMCQARMEAETEAIASFTKAAELGEKEDADKQMSNLYAKKALAAYKVKNNAGALESALKSAEFGPNPQVEKIGGICAYNLKKLDEAIKLLEKSLAGDDDTTAKYYLARAYDDKGNAVKACTYYKQITADPKFKAFATGKITQLQCK